jgi:hypothetical protein
MLKKSFKRRGGLIPLLFLFFIFSYSSAFSNNNDKCKTCHIIESAQNHSFGCIECHGGDKDTKDKNLAHKMMFGGKNPSNKFDMDKTCGKCHYYQIIRVKTSIMFTNTGIINKLKKALGKEDNKIHSLNPGENYNEKGIPATFYDVATDNSFSSELFRKFCSSCHLGDELNLIDNIRRSSGCSTCHYPYNEKGEYRGNDKTILGKTGYSNSHKLEPLPPDTVCLSCHHRSGRTGLSYYGKFDGNDPKIPILEKFAERTITHIKADIHKELGLECIDCHTSREIMGDGYIYNYLYDQIEISCENCHGSYKEKPKAERIVRENASPFVEGKNYKVLLKNGTNFVLTNKKLPFSNVYEKDGKYYLIKKRDGKIFELKIITNNTNHNIIGHERLECYTCHSRTVPQCYGCHTFYDKRFETKDFIKKEVTNGAFYEKEGFRIAYPFPLGVNHKNRVSPITPGCQTNLYLIDEKGYFIAEKVVPKIDNKINYKFAPIYSHNTGKKALKCEECHYNPFFAGFGYTLFSKNDKAITGKVLCEKSATGNLDSFITVNKGGLKTSMTILREKARPLNKDEILKLIKPSLCIICHRSSDDKIYRSKLDYNIDDPLHRKYLK